MDRLAESIRRTDERIRTAVARRLGVKVEDVTVLQRMGKRGVEGVYLVPASVVDAARALGLDADAR